MVGCKKVLLSVFFLVVFVSITSCGRGTASSVDFVKKANWLGEADNDIYLFHKNSGGQAKSLEEVFASYGKFKEVSWEEIKASSDKEKPFVEVRGLLLNADDMAGAINDLLEQDESWVLKSMQVMPTNAKPDRQAINKVLNEIKEKKLCYITLLQFLPEPDKNRAQFLYMGGALVDPNGKIVHSEARIKNYNLTMEKTNFYRNIEYTDVKTSLAELIMLEQGYTF